MVCWSPARIFVRSARVFGRLFLTIQLLRSRNLKRRVASRDATRHDRTASSLPSSLPIAASIHRMTRLLYRFPLAASRNGDRRRSLLCIALAYLIRVERNGRNLRTSSPQELDHLPFPEETMTVEVSPAWNAFLHAANLRSRRATWSDRNAPVTRDRSGSERLARVVRIGPAQKDSPLSHVAVEFLS